MVWEPERNLAAAYEYCQLGHAVFPAKGKVPCIRNWSRTDPPNCKQLYRWFNNRPERNISLRTGNGILAIDVDPARSGVTSWDSLVAGVELPETAKAATGGEGWHWLFRCPLTVGCFHDLPGWPGIDVKGVGGQIIVEPSIHPTTGRPYLWERHPRDGIDYIPSEIFGRLLGSADATVDRVIDPARQIDNRSGDVASLIEQMVERFPVPGYGTRGGQFAKVVPSLVGRGFDDATVEDVVVGWWTHHFDRGLCRTPPDHAAREARRYAGLLRMSGRFAPATSGLNHREQCRAIVLPDEAYSRMTQPDENCQSRGLGENTMGLTLINRRLSDRLCRSDDEVAFVEALLMQAHHCLSLGLNVVRMTGDQVREIAADRHPGIAWDDKQLDRLSRKYVDRPDRPATVGSLIRRTIQGCNAIGRQVARPSEYEITGLAELVGLGTCEPIPSAA